MKTSHQTPAQARGYSDSEFARTIYFLWHADDEEYTELIDRYEEARAIGTNNICFGYYVGTARGTPSQIDASDHGDTGLGNLEPVNINRRPLIRRCLEWFDSKSFPKSSSLQQHQQPYQDSH